MKTRLKTHYHTFSKLIFPLARKSMRNLNLLLKLVLSSSINNLVTSLPSKSISHWVWYSFRKSTKIKKIQSLRYTPFLLRQNYHETCDVRENCIDNCHCKLLCLERNLFNGKLSYGSIIDFWKFTLYKTLRLLISASTIPKMILVIFYNFRRCLA